MTSKKFGHDAIVGMAKDVGVTVIDNRTPLPFNSERLHALFTAECDRLEISRREGAKRIGLTSYSAISRLDHGQGIDSNTLVLFMRWLGITDLAPFMR